MINPFIDIQRRRDLRQWELEEEKRQEREARESIQKQIQDFYREAIQQAKEVAPGILRMMHHLKFALYGNDRDYWVDHWILNMHTVMRTDFTQADPQSILKYPCDEDLDRSIWPIAEWSIIQHFPRNPACTPSYIMTDRDHRQGYSCKKVSVSLIYTQDKRAFFSCRRSTDRKICVVSKDELVHCLSQLCEKEEEKPYKAKHRPRF